MPKSKRKNNKFYVRLKGYDNSFNIWIDQKYIVKMNYFPEPYTSSKRKIKAELDLTNYATKSYLKSATGNDTSEFAKKT